MAGGVAVQKPASFVDQGLKTLTFFMFFIKLPFIDADFLSIAKEFSEVDEKGFMFNWYSAFTLVSLLFFLGACTTLSGTSKGLYTSDALRNHFPAPPEVFSQEKTQIKKQEAENSNEAQLQSDPIKNKNRSARKNESLSYRLSQNRHEQNYQPSQTLLKHLRTQAEYRYMTAEVLSLRGPSIKSVQAFREALVYDPSSVALRVRLAEEYKAIGFEVEALEQLSIALEIQPNHLNAVLLLGEVYASLEMHDRAIKHYRAFIKRNPKEQEARVYLGALLAEQGRFGAAERVFSKLAYEVKGAEAYRAYYYLGRILSDQIETAPIQARWALFLKAERAYKKSLKARPDGELSVVSLSHLYEKMNQDKKFFNVLLSFQKRFGPSKEVSRLLSLKFLEKGRYPQALEQLGFLEDHDGGDVNTKVKMALILISQKKYHRAIHKLEEILQQAPSSGKMRFYLGVVYEEVGDLEKARLHFEKILPTSEYYPEALVRSALLHRSTGTPEVSLQLLRQAVEYDEVALRAYVIQGSILNELKKYNESASLLQGAMERFPESPQLLFFSGVTQSKLENDTEAFSLMKRVLKLEPNHVLALNFLAYSYAEQGVNLDEAEILAGRAVALAPDDPYILDTLGWVYFKQGRLSEARIYLEKAYHGLDGKESVVAEHLGDLYRRLKFFDKAVKVYGAAVLTAETPEKAAEINSKISGIRERGLRQPANSQPAAKD